MKNIQILISVLISSVLLFGCSQKSKKDEIKIIKKVNIDKIVKIDFGKSVKLSDESEIKFSDLVSDSRCPIGAKCVWQGTAEIGLELKQGSEKHKFSLELISKKKDSKLDTLGYSFELQSLTPYPQLNSEIPNESYQATISILSR